MTTPTETALLRELDKKLGTAADRLRSSLDAAMYKHAVLGLIFFKYVSDSFEMRQQEVLKQRKSMNCGCFLDTVESRTLPALRDTLLPKLMQGEVRVKATTTATTA